MSAPAGLGRTEYRAYCALLGVVPDDGLSPLERPAALPSWLGPELCASAPARARLRRWAVDAGSPVATGAMIRSRVAFVGDPDIRAIVVQALEERIPPPVVHHVLSVCWIFGVGWSTAGWNCVAPPLPSQPPEPLQLINVAGHSGDGEDIAGTFAHEVAHSWVLAPSDALEELEPVQEREQRWRSLQQMAVAVGRLDVLFQLAMRNERRAAACARAWGFTGRGANGEACALAARHRIRTDAAALPPLDAEASPSAPKATA